MRPFLLILLLLLAMRLEGQRYEMGINVGPSISYRTSPPSGDPVAVSIQNGEEGIYTFDFGLDMRRHVGDRVKLGLGLWYSQKGFSNTNASITYEKLNLLNKIVQIDFIQNYIEIPLTVFYRLNKSNESDLYAIAGYNNSILFSQKNDVILRAGEVNKNELEELKEPYLRNDARYNPGFLVGLGWQKRIDENYSFGLEPSFKMMLSPLRENRFMTHRRLYSLGLNFQFIRTL